MTLPKKPPTRSSIIAGSVQMITCTDGGIHT
jgi:hypothetical protein